MTPLADIPTEWLLRCLAVLDTDPATRDDQGGSIGLPVRPYVTETHRLMCGACRNEWHPVDPDDQAWYGRCATCNSTDLTVESEVVPNAPSHEWHLRCAICEATWVGWPGEPCDWCERRQALQLEHQAELVLTAPDVDPDDKHYEDRMTAWQDRMFVAIEAGIIDEDEGHAAWRRAQRKRAS